MEQAPKRMTTRTKAALWLMIGPTALIIVSFVVFALLNFLASMTAAPVEDGLFRETSPLQTIGNVLLFFVGAISVVTWLPGLIAGIVLLATKK